jgi:hypothetical protein
MNQALYAHMNNKRKMKKQKRVSFCVWFSIIYLGVEVGVSLMLEVF